MLDIFTVNPCRVKKRGARFHEGYPVLRLIERRLLGIPFEHLLCIYSIEALCKPPTAAIDKVASLIDAHQIPSRVLLPNQLPDPRQMPAHRSVMKAQAAFQV